MYTYSRIHIIIHEHACTPGHTNAAHMHKHSTYTYAELILIAEWFR